MSEWALYEDPAAVGRQIRQARRELGLTQADLAARIGVSLRALDRFESGQDDPADKLERIAEITGRPVSWYTSPEEHGAGDNGTYDGGLPTELRKRLAESGGRRGAADDGEAVAPADPGAAISQAFLEEESASHGEPTAAPNATLLDERPRATRASEELAEERRLLAEERRLLVEQRDELRATLALEREGNDARAAQLTGELERVEAARRTLAGMLEQSGTDLARARAQHAELTERISRLETERAEAEARAANAAVLLQQAETEIAAARDERRGEAAALDRRDAELARRSSELDAREAAVEGGAADLGLRSARLETETAELRFRAAQLDTREADLAYRSTQLDSREADLAYRSTRLDTREAELTYRSARLDTREATLDGAGPRATGDADVPRPAEEHPAQESQ